MKEKANKNRKTDAKTELRRRAEKVRSSRDQGKADLTGYDKDKLIHELEVHQIELEMQNEELRRTQEELRESHDRYVDLFDLAPVGYFILDRHFGILQVNLTASRMLGLERGMLKGRKLSSFVAADSQNIFYMCIKAEKTVSDELCEIEMRGNAGMSFYVHLKSTTVPSGSEVRYRVAMTDITGLKQSEQTIIRLNESLTRSKNEIETAYQELKEMDDVISLELKEAVRRINGFSLALLEDQGKNLDKEGLSYLERIRTISRVTSDHLDDLIKLSQVSTAKAEYEPVNLSLLVENTAARLKAGNPQRQVELAIQQGLRVIGDRQLLQLAVKNLLDNAFKFTSGCTRAVIEVGVAVSGGEEAYFVRDNGIGFDIGNAERLFIPFQRWRAGLGEGVAGIGLAIVRRVISRHGGRVWAEAEPGGGAAFYFTLPPGVDSSKGYYRQVGPVEKTELPQY